MSEPVILELAPLPRDQVGPFLLLGLDKNADAEAIEAHWAERLKLARRQLLAIPLEDINWAREILRDEERRWKADVASLNTELEDGLLARLAKRFSSPRPGTPPAWQPFGVEPDFSQYEPAVELHDMEAIRAAVSVPEVPEQFPAAIKLLEDFVKQPIDPWGIQLPMPPVTEAGDSISHE